MQVEVSIQIKADGIETTQPEVSHKTDRGENPQAIAASISPDTWQQWFQCWLENLNPDISPVSAYALTLRLTDDAEIQALNATYRQQNRPTDVLAFAALEADIPLPPSEAEQGVELGDIVISVETALAQALEQRHTPQFELAWLACHGLLHLLGWDHPDAASLERMLAQQRLLLKLIRWSELG